MKMKTNNIRRFATIFLLSLMTISVYGTIVEIMPQFPDGDAALKKFLEENVRCPKKVIRAGISGRIVASFVVEKDGSITELKIVKNLLKNKDGGPIPYDSEVLKKCEKEALRVLKFMPKWIPGTQNGEPVRVKYCVPVVFNQPKPKSD